MIVCSVAASVRNHGGTPAANTYIIMKTITELELSEVVGGQQAQPAPITAAQYSSCMTNAGQNFNKTNNSIVQGFQSGKLSQDDFVNQGVGSAKAYQGAAADCAKQFPLQ